MNKKKSLLLSIIIVLILGLIITSGSFAYFQWSLGYASGTGVNVTIEHGGITMHIESEQTEFVGLYPTKNCLNKHAYGDALVTIVNNTGTIAIPSFKLKVRVLKNGTEPLSQEDLSHIRYTVVPLETTKNIFGRPVKGEVMNDSNGESYACNYPMMGLDSFDDTKELFKNSTGGWTTQFKFESVSTDGSWSSIPSRYDESYLGSSWEYLDADEYLPRQYSLTTGEVNGITFRGEAYSTSYKYFRVYVWIDEGYTTTIIGNTVSDPLQNAKIEITWSEESMVQQVSGESNAGGIEYAAGFYGENDSFISWEKLIGDGDITLTGTKITKEITKRAGVLVVPNEITEIGYGAFAETNITEIKFNQNSQLTTIGAGAFDSSNITSIEIPASVTTIGDSAFVESTLQTVTFAENSRLTTIDSIAFAGTNIRNIKIPASVTSIGQYAFSNSSLQTITFAADSRLSSIGGAAFSDTDLTSIEIPASVTVIDSGAFDNCNLGENLTFAPNSQLESLNSGALQNSGLTRIEIPSSVTYIGDGALASNEVLGTIVFKGTVTGWNAIDRGELWNLDSLITKVICSDGVITIREAGLYDSTWALTKTWQQLLNNGDITVVNNVITASTTLLSGTVDNPESGFLIIPEGIIGIGDNSFTGMCVDTCNLSVYVPSSVEYIGDNSFNGASLTALVVSPDSKLTIIEDMAFHASTLKKVVFGRNGSLKTIGRLAFGMGQLESINIPASLIEIGDEAFTDLGALHTIKFEGTMAQWNAITKGNNWNINVGAAMVICTDGVVPLQ